MSQKCTRSLEGEAHTSTCTLQPFCTDVQLRATLSDGNFIQMLYMVETRLHSNSNNLELHEAGSACWVLHSNHLTDSNGSRIFLSKTRESKRTRKVSFLITSTYVKVKLFFNLHHRNQVYLSGAFSLSIIQEARRPSRQLNYRPFYEM